MQDVFVVTALKWDGDWIIQAQVGETDTLTNTWKSPPRGMSLEALMDLIERPNTIVASRTRSGTAGPNLLVHVGPKGERTVRPAGIPGVPDGLAEILKDFT